MPRQNKDIIVLKNKNISKTFTEIINKTVYHDLIKMTDTAGPILVPFLIFKY